MNLAERPRFSETWTLDDLAVLGLPLQHPSHRDITCYEALAQLGLMLCLRSVVPSARWVVRLRTLSGAEAGIHKLYSSHYPLSAFLQRLCVLACVTGIELDVSHVPGGKNDDADWFFSLGRPHRAIASTVSGGLPRGLQP